MYADRIRHIFSSFCTNPIRYKELCLINVRPEASAIDLFTSVMYAIPLKHALWDLYGTLTTIIKHLWCVALCLKFCYTGCLYIEWRYAECSYTNCGHTECSCSEFCYAYCHHSNVTQLSVFAPPNLHTLFKVCFVSF